MRFLAPAKINLFLRILSKSNNNYHNLQSIFHMVDLYDEISIKPRSDRKIIVENDDESISKESDLCLRAAQLILDGRKLGVTIKVKKKYSRWSWVGRRKLRCRNHSSSIKSNI